MASSAEVGKLPRRRQRLNSSRGGALLCSYLSRGFGAGGGGEGVGAGSRPRGRRFKGGFSAPARAATGPCAHAQGRTRACARPQPPQSTPRRSHLQPPSQPPPRPSPPSRAHFAATQRQTAETSVRRAPHAARGAAPLAR